MFVLSFDLPSLVWSESLVNRNINLKEIILQFYKNKECQRYLGLETEVFISLSLPLSLSILYMFVEFFIYMFIFKFSCTLQEIVRWSLRFLFEIGIRPEFCQTLLTLQKKKKEKKKVCGWKFYFEIRVKSLELPFPFIAESAMSLPPLYHCLSFGMKDHLLLAPQECCGHVSHYYKEGKRQQ